MRTFFKTFIANIFPETTPVTFRTWNTYKDECMELHFWQFMKERSKFNGEISPKFSLHPFSQYVMFKMKSMVFLLFFLTDAVAQW